MRVADLGDLDGPVLAFGGPYSNLHALRALLDVASGLGIAPGNLICTGDVVAYGADPLGCVAAIRDAGVAVVAGNVEAQLADGALDCGCGFDAGSTCDLLSAGWYGYANAHVTDEARAWMVACPDIVVFRQSGRLYATIHGGAVEKSRFLWPVTPEEDLARDVARLTEALGPIDGVISGHSGVAFVRQVNGVAWINAGVIGMPPHDGTQSTEYAILDGGVATLHRLDYDAAAARQAMVAAGLTQGYHDTLVTGIWPSEEVLPAAMRRHSRASG